MRETEFFDFPLPANPDAERLVLGSILLNGAIFPQISAVLSAHDFSLEKHRRIFARMLELDEHGEPIDRITLTSALMDQGQLESVDGMAYIVSLDAGLPEIPNLDSYVRIVQEKSILRQAVFACTSVIRETLGKYGDSAAVIARLQELTDSLNKAARVDDLATIERITEEVGPGKILGTAGEIAIPSPWLRLNQIIGGFNPSEMACIGARPSQGKTVMACQIALHAAEQGKHAVIFSLEMNKESLLRRFVSARSGIAHHRLRSGELDAEARHQAQFTLAELCELKTLYMDDRSSTLAKIRAQLTKTKARHPIDLVVIDYLQLIATPSTRSRVEQITEISRGIKDLARQFNCAMVVPSQLSRESEKEKREPRLSDLRDSGTIEQDSDLVIFPHRKDDQQPEETHVATDFIVAKQRNGRLGRAPVVFEKPFQRFTEE